MPDNAMHFRVTGLKILETFLDNLEKKKGGGGKIKKRHMQLSTEVHRKPLMQCNLGNIPLL